MNVRIKIGAVVALGKQEDPRFADLYGRMKNDFENEEFVRRVCLHEAAHAELMEQDGIPNIKFAGPDIFYNPYTDKFIATGARVLADDPDAVVDDDYIFRAATHSAAGGVALELAGYAGFRASVAVGVIDSKPFRWHLDYQSRRNATSLKTYRILAGKGDVRRGGQAD